MNNCYSYLRLTFVKCVRTVRYNIRYARPDASDHEVEAAATHADMHEKILGFPDGYDTKESHAIDRMLNAVILG